MPDPFRGEVCAAWLDHLAELEPEVLLTVMAAVAEGCTDKHVRERTRDVYLFDLAYANDPDVRFTYTEPRTGAV